MLVLDRDAFAKVSSCSKCLVDKDFTALQSDDDALTVDLVETCARQAAVIHELIDKEHDLLSLNWLRVGHLLDDFVEWLINDCLGVSPIIEGVVNRYKSDKNCSPNSTELMVSTRDIENSFLITMLFSELEFEDKEDLCFLSKKASVFIMEYFTTVATRQTVAFF